MNTKGFKQMLIGEKMPDKDDPKYKERYERDVRAGRKFAKMCRIDKAAAKVQRFADLHKTLFLVIVFGFVGVSFSFNIYRMANLCTLAAALSILHILANFLPALTSRS